MQWVICTQIFRAVVIRRHLLLFLRGSVVCHRNSMSAQMPFKLRVDWAKPDAYCARATTSISWFPRLRIQTVSEPGLWPAKAAQITSFPSESRLSWMLNLGTLPPSHPQLSIPAVHKTAMSVAKACPFVSTIILIGVLCQITKVARFQVVAVHHVVSRSYAAALCEGGSAYTP